MVSKASLTKAKSLSIPPAYLIFILFLSFIVFNTFYFPQNILTFGLRDYIKGAIFIFLSAVLVIAQWQIVISSLLEAGSRKFIYTAIILLPLAFLLFFNRQSTRLPAFVPLAVIFFNQFYLWGILTDNQRLVAICRKQKKIIFFILALYIPIFVIIAIRQYINFSNFNPKDFAIYNQTFWNTIHGRFFNNSTYGSNYTCHNSPFFFLLAPFYYLIPHPVTLSAIKTFLLAFSVIPFYLIIRRIITDQRAFFPLLCSYLFYPFLVSQNFTPAHEISYAPLFILSAYYFYQLKKFWLYLLILLITLSIKEHVALIAIMFGFYSLFKKRSKRWVLAPMALGIAWGLFSFWIIGYFNRLYPGNADATWFLVDFKRRFLQNEPDLARSIITRLSYSNIGQWNSLKQSFLFFTCVGGIFPLLSLELILGTPEFILALLSDRPAMLGVPWHYTVIFSCFLFISAVNGVRNISEWRIARNLSLSSGKIQALLAAIIFSLTLIHIYTWIDLAAIEKTNFNVKAAKEAVAMVPGNAFITVPREIAPFVSSREKYSILEDTAQNYGDYILIQDSVFEELSGKNGMGQYRKLFESSGIILLERK